MKVFTKSIDVKARAESLLDITPLASGAVKESGVSSGIVTIFVPGATGAVSTIEYEPGLLKDIPRALERIAPSNEDYEHHKTWGDDNGKSHVRATLIGPSLVVPLKDKQLMLGRWQQVVFMNLDTSDRERTIIFQIIGE
ncbi:MAG: secondary thiamine-phosphate synthase enzyme YjbQ [Candidatus Hydrothermarchaeota archaeon]|nr:secondary thiamine-phosphate synthase enzyme YjbQ [Candidatus Hydrothermarchaeota archaeon]